MTLIIVVLSLICFSLMATLVLVIREIAKNDKEKLDKFLGTVSYLSGAEGSESDGSDDIVSIDELEPKELIDALNKDYENYED